MVAVVFYAATKAMDPIADSAAASVY